jgi:hypothetical protein
MNLSQYASAKRLESARKVLSEMVPAYLRDGVSNFTTIEEFLRKYKLLDGFNSMISEGLFKGKLITEVSKTVIDNPIDFLTKTLLFAAETKGLDSDFRMHSFVGSSPIYLNPESNLIEFNKDWDVSSVTLLLLATQTTMSIHVYIPKVDEIQKMRDLLSESLPSPNFDSVFEATM